MIDRRPRNKDQRYHANTPGSRKRQEPPDTTETDRGIEEVPSPRTDDAARTVEHPSFRTTEAGAGSASEPVDADRVTNRRSKKYRG